MPNRNPLYFVGALLFAFVVTFGAGYSVGRGTASADALAANRRADSLVVVIGEREAALTAALAANDIVTDQIDRVKEKAVAPRARVRAVDLAAVPDTCRPLVQTILADADTVFVTDSTAIVKLEAQNAVLANELAGATTLLLKSRSELAQQAQRTSSAPPKKLLGILPRPALTAGYGATLADGRIYTGPQVGVSFKVVL